MGATALLQPPTKLVAVEVVVEAGAKRWAGGGMAGGNGGLYGGGGGGGGATRNGYLSGKGGDGTSGIAIIVTLF